MSFYVIAQAFVRQNQSWKMATIILFYAFIQSALQGFCLSITLSRTHLHTDNSELPRRVLTNHQEQFRVQCVAQGHFEMWTGRGGDRTGNPVISGRSALPPEPQPPNHAIQMINAEQQTPVILALCHYGSRTTTLMRAMRIPNVSDWLTPLTGKVRERETRDTLCCQIWMQQSFASSLHVQKCWNKELFLHFKVLLPAASVTIFRKSSNHDWDGKTTSEPRQWALETSHLGKKYNTALGIYHVYIINCAIYNTLMKDDEIISHLQRKRRKMWNELPRNSLVV